MSKPKAQVVISMGTGGVGKTTISAATAYRYAQQGKKVVCLTIDPSRRLKDTLHLQDTGEVLPVPWRSVEGRLYGCVLNSKKVFDDFVIRAAGRSELVERLFRNRLYQELSTSLSGSQEFTALEQLFQLVHASDFDIVVVDTPPAQHAFDFLTAPQRLAALFNEGVASWFRGLSHPRSNNLVRRIFQTGTRQVMKGLETLTGAQFLGELADFFQSLQVWQGKIDQRLAEVHRLLVAPGTDFQLILTSDLLQRRQSEQMMKRLKREGYHLRRWILNRSTPDWVREFANEPDERYQKILGFYQQRELAVRDMVHPSTDLWMVPESLDQDLSSEEGLRRIASHLEEKK